MAGGVVVAADPAEVDLDPVAVAARPVIAVAASS